MAIVFDDYVVRDWELGDVESIVTHANNRKIWINMRDRFPHPYEIADAEKFIRNALSLTPVTIFAIANAKEAIGGIGLHIMEDVHRFTAEMGYWLGEPFWGRGIMSAIVKEFVPFAFDSFELNRIFAMPYATNTPSIRVLKKAGFEYEGVLRANVYKDGKVLDQAVYSKINVEV
jgi:RimJ/RimL family protein N-acetyltransferase